MANKIKASNIDTNAITADSISYPLTTFSSTGIDDNATSTAITIDSSENVGIKTTTPATELDISSGAITGGTKRYITLTSLNASSSEVAYADVGATFNQNAAGNESGGIDFRCSHNGSLANRYSFGGGAGDIHAWYTGAGTERMRILSTGEVLIAGTSIYSGASPELHVEGDIDLGNGGTATERELTFSRSSSTGVIGRINSRIAGFSTMPMIEFGCTSTAGGTQAGDLKFYTTSSATRALRMTIADSGSVLIGTTGNGTTGGLVSIPNNNNSFLRIGHVAGSGSTSYYHQFFYNGSQIGNIWQNGTTGVSYNTSSDYRLKENIVPINSAIDRVKALNPVRFNFKSAPDRIVDGFLAHEAQSVVPEAVGGTKDEMSTEEYEITPAVLDGDGNVITEAVMGTREVPLYQGIDQSKLVPLLTAGLKEAIAKIETLEARITALENN